MASDKKAITSIDDLRALAKGEEPRSAITPLGDNYQDHLSRSKDFGMEPLDPVRWHIMKALGADDEDVFMKRAISAGAMGAGEKLRRSGVRSIEAGEDLAAVTRAKTPKEVMKLVDKVEVGKLKKVMGKILSGTGAFGFLSTLVDPESAFPDPVGEGSDEVPREGKRKREPIFWIKDDE